MGIQGLLPFLKAIHTPVNIADFQGSTVAIDAYCWLHKGAFSCAEKLALGEKTDQYVYYCMKYIEYMLRKNLKPILVFDGCHLKSKADVEKTRRERRELHRKKAAQFLREGKRNEAKECLQRCVDITPQMALELMNACRDRGVDCIVAPYEADAQLAYLNLKGIADIIVTEDSDLLLFGCDKIIFKMDFFGNGTLIEKSRLNEVLSIKGGFYTFEKFRHMCILSGCDYLPSIPGIGLAKACKVMKSARQPDIRQLLKKLSTYLNSSLTVTDEYVEGFVRADNTFLYQLVFDPVSCKLCPLNPYPPELETSSLDYAGQYIQEHMAFQIALGNIDIHNYKAISYFDPHKFVMVNLLFNPGDRPWLCSPTTTVDLRGGCQNLGCFCEICDDYKMAKAKNAARPKFRHQLSIWDKSYRTKSGSPCKQIQERRDDEIKSSLHAREQTIVVRPVRRSSTNKHKSGGDESNMRTENELVSMYGEDGENKSSDVKTVTRNLAESEFGFNHSPSKNLECKATDVAKPTSSDKKQTACTRRQPNDESFDENSHQEDNSEDEKPKQCRKRRMSTTPTRPSAANIGEDAFRNTSGLAPETCGSGLTPETCGSGLTPESCGSRLTPEKGRNIFAVQTSAVKLQKFDLDAPAVRVKSRYFVSGSSSGQQTPGQKKTSPTRQQSLTKSQHKTATSSSTQKDLNAKVPRSSRVVFENAPACLPQNEGADRESQPAPKKGIYKYFCPPTSELQSAQDSFKSLAPKHSDQAIDIKQEDMASSKPVSGNRSQGTQRQLSVFEKFQSTFRQSSPHQSKPSPSSAFHWSNIKSGVEVASLKCTVPLTDGRDEFDKKQTRLEGGSDQTKTEDASLESSSHQESCGESCEASSGYCTAESLEEHLATSSAFGQVLPCKKKGSGVKSTPGNDSRGQMTDDQSHEVTELQSYSYDDFLKSLDGDTQSGQTENNPIVPGRQAWGTAGLGSHAMADRLEEPASPSVDVDSQGTCGDSQLLKSSMSWGEETVPSGKGSPSIISCSFDSKCFPVRDDVIDISDTEADSQTSCVSSLPSSASPRGQRQPKCRLSGLSRGKSQSSGKKTNTSLPGQRSIKDLMNKFHYRRNSESVSLTQ